MLSSRRQQFWQRNTEPQRHRMETVVPEEEEFEDGDLDETICASPSSSPNKTTNSRQATPMAKDQEEDYHSSEWPLFRQGTQVTVYGSSDLAHREMQFFQEPKLTKCRSFAASSQTTGRLARPSRAQEMSHHTRLSNPTTHSKTRKVFPSHDSGKNRQTLSSASSGGAGPQSKQLGVQSSSTNGRTFTPHPGAERKLIKMESLIDFAWPRQTEKAKPFNNVTGGNGESRNILLERPDLQKATRATRLHKRLNVIAERPPSSFSSLKMNKLTFPSDSLLKPAANISMGEFCNRSPTPQASRFYSKPNQRALDALARRQDGGNKISPVHNLTTVLSSSNELVTNESSVSPNQSAASPTGMEKDMSMPELPSISESKTRLMVGGPSQTSTIVPYSLNDSSGSSLLTLSLSSGEDVSQQSDESSSADCIDEEIEEKLTTTNVCSSDENETTNITESLLSQEEEDRPLVELETKQEGMTTEGEVVKATKGELLVGGGELNYSDESLSSMIRPPSKKKLLKAAKFRGGVIQSLHHLTPTIKMEYYNFVNDVEETTFYASQQTEALLLHKGYTPQTVLFISSSVPHHEVLQKAVKPGVILIPYDYSEQTLTGLLDLAKTALTDYMKGAKAKHIGFVCKGGPGYLYLVKGKVLTPAKLRKADAEDLVHFWRKLGGHMSKIHPGKSVVHLMESNVAGNKQGELLLDDLEAVMFSHKVKVQSPLELSANGKEMLSLYYMLPQYRLWKMTRYSKVRLYKP